MESILQEPWKIILSGGLAGAFSRTLTAPADRLKVLYQAGFDSSASSNSINSSVNRIRINGNGATITLVAPTSRAARCPSIMELCRTIYREGGAKAFYRGNGTNVIKTAPETSVRFLMYHRLRQLISSDATHPKVWERFVAGAGAGAIAQVTIYPLEVAKTRLALSSGGQYSGLFNVIHHTCKYEGIRALYRGLGASLAGIIPYAGVDLAVFHSFKDVYIRHNGERPSSFLLLCFGAVSSICGQSIAFPLQLIRTRLQAQGMAGRPVIYDGIIDCFMKTVRSDGVIGLYKGILPNFIKAVPAIAISYVVFEKSMERLIDG